MFRLVVTTAFLIAVSQSHANECIPRPPGSKLWSIIHDECVPQTLKGAAERSCVHVDLSRGEEAGSVIFRDRKGTAHLLLLPTRRVSGIEDKFLLSPDAPNYFSRAWDAGSLVIEMRGNRPPRNAIAVAINSKCRRDQDQLHLHVACLRPAVFEKLAEFGGAFDLKWQRMPAPLNGRTYWARRLSPSDNLPDSRPFNLLAEELDDAKQGVENFSLVLVRQKEQFVLLADRAESNQLGGHAEDLLDGDCKAYQAPP